MQKQHFPSRSMPPDSPASSRRPSLVMAAAGLLALGLVQSASAQTTSPRDPFTQGARSNQFDPYTQGARSDQTTTLASAGKAERGKGARNPYTQGARAGARDPYTDGARTGPRSPYTDGANSGGGSHKKGKSKLKS